VGPRKQEVQSRRESRNSLKYSVESVRGADRPVARAPPPGVAGVAAALAAVGVALAVAAVGVALAVAAAVACKHSWTVTAVPQSSSFDPSHNAMWPTVACKCRIQDPLPSARLRNEVSYVQHNAQRSQRYREASCSVDTHEPVCPQIGWGQEIVIWHHMRTSMGT